ncbi:hypothetical protein KVR01_010718 [Diaporthe batatas]|uniref:uncharacterized protein n=1 Tax=Diaporthe batatas TaxID=748121 RepID=UPI001D059407|nr:uncharacterized protein KVR01_010718 [Diaporthe batatas]KAG8160081.1 hypothetical protein KVR01_010718 [Diaporthe batatas]
MSLQAYIQAALAEIKASDVTAKPMTYLLATFLFVLFVYSLDSNPKSKAPFLNPRRAFELTAERPKGIYVRGCRSLLKTWFNTHPNEPAQLITDFGNMTVLPPSMANEVRNDPNLSFNDFIGDASKITKPLADETALAVPDLFGDSKEWHSLPLKDTILTLVARISSRVFLGEELCRNEAWHKISREYTTTVFPAADVLRAYPAGIIRSIAARLLPICRAASAQVAEARSVLRPVLERRAAAKKAAAAEGRKVEFNDAVEWFENAAAKAGADYEPAAMQLFLSIVAIHTTSDLLTQVMEDLAGHPEVVEDLRTEIKEVLSDGGWKKTSLTNMKLLDSVIKESQRLKPTQLGDGYRFYNIRRSGEPGKENTSLLVSTTPEHMGFGHGIHACPGRFMAANEIKIALVFILLNYDWKLPEGVKPKTHEFGIALNTDAAVEILARKREDDFDLSGIE